MAQIGLHAYIALSLKKKLPAKKWFFVSFLFGSILPDIDGLFIFLSSLIIPLNISLNIYHRTFTHNIFIVIFLYLFFLIIYEIKKNKSYLYIGNGMMLGMLLHLSIDIFLWFDSIHLFWPLPSNRIDLWSNLSISIWIVKLLMVFEFIFFRLFAWEMTKIVIECPQKNGCYLQSLNYFMRIQVFFIITFSIISYFLNESIIYYFFSFYYIPSMIIMIYYVYKLKNSINEYIFLKKEDTDGFLNTSDKTPIKNIQ